MPPVLIVVTICLLIPALLFLANLSVVYTNFPQSDSLQKMSLVEFAARAGFQLRPELKPRLDSKLESFQLSSGFLSGEVCELCSKSRTSCHHDLAKEAQRWMRHTFERGPAWIPLKPFQEQLMEIALQTRYEDAVLLKIIAYARLLHSSFMSMDELCIRQFKFQCELLTLDQNLQVDMASASFAYAKQAHYNPEILRGRFIQARKTCGLR